MSATEGQFAIRQGIRAGEAVARRAALVFAFFVLAYSYFYFDYASAWLMVFAFSMTIVAAWMAGIVSSAFCAWIVKRYTAGGGASLLLSSQGGESHR